MAESIARNVVVPKDLVTSMQRVAGPKRTQLKLYPTRGAGPLTVPYAGTTTVQFEFPTKSINFPLSRIAGNIVFPASGDQYIRTYVTADSPSLIGAGSFKARTGGTLFDMEYVPNFCKMVNRYDKDINEVMSNDERDAIFPLRSNTETRNITGSVINHAYVEAAYNTHSGLNAAYTLPLGESLADIFPHTIFAKKHDIKFPEIMTLTLRLGPGNRYAWLAGSNGNDVPWNTVADLAGDITITDFHILLSINDDPKLEDVINRELMSGVRYVMDTVVCSQNRFPQTDSQNVSITYNSGHGKRIKKIYHSVFNNTETRNVALDNDCVATRKVTEYTVKINDRSITDDKLLTNPVYPTAYYYHKPLLKGTSVTSANIYHANFVHIEDLGRLGSPHDQNLLGIRPESVVAGISLDQDFKFTFAASTQNVAYVHYTFAVVQRDILITATSIHID